MGQVPVGLVFVSAAFLSLLIAPRRLPRMNTRFPLRPRQPFDPLDDEPLAPLPRRSSAPGRVRIAPPSSPRRRTTQSLGRDIRGHSGTSPSTGVPGKDFTVLPRFARSRKSRVSQNPLPINSGYSGAWSSVSWLTFEPKPHAAMWRQSANHSDHTRSIAPRQPSRLAIRKPHTPPRFSRKTREYSVTTIHGSGRGRPGHLHTRASKSTHPPSALVSRKICSQPDNRVKPPQLSSPL